MAEDKVFVFVAVFLLLYASLLGTLPVGFTTDDYESPQVQGIDPQLIAGFDSYVMYNATNFTLGQLDYGLGGHYWTALDYTNSLTILRREAVFFWWVYASGTFAFEGADRGSTLSWVEVYGDAENGSALYSFTTPTVTSGVVISWNTTTYSYPWDAWGNDSLFVVHGIGASSYASQSALSLVLSMLVWSAPDIPLLLQILLSAPIQVCIVWILFYVLEKLIPG